MGSEMIINIYIYINSVGAWVILIYLYNFEMNKTPNLI